MRYKGEPRTVPYSQINATTGAVSRAVSVRSVSGALASQSSAEGQFLSWQPSTWPAAPKRVDSAFIAALRQIFDDSIVGEIGNVIHDVKQANGDLQHRGHVIGIALICALEAIASYGYRTQCVKKFVEAHFPQDYQPHAADLYDLYRNSLVHSWNLFEAAILPGEERIEKSGGILSFGLLNFFQALQEAVEGFLRALSTDSSLQANTLNRYKQLRDSAR